MLMHFVLFQAWKVLGAWRIVEHATHDDAELKRLGTIGTYNRVREEILRRDDKRFHKAGKPPMAMGWEDVCPLLGGFVLYDAEVLVGWVELETGELLRFVHGRRYCNVSDVFKMRAYPIPVTPPEPESSCGSLFVQPRTKDAAAMVYVEYIVMDKKRGVRIRYEFFLRAIL